MSGEWDGERALRGRDHFVWIGLQPGTAMSGCVCSAERESNKASLDTRVRLQPASSTKACKLKRSGGTVLEGYREGAMYGNFPCTSHLGSVDPGTIAPVF